MALCAVMSGAEGGEERAADGPAQAEGGQSCCALPPGLPSPATFRRVLSRRKPDELPPGFVHWPEALRASLAGASVARDGPTRRRSLEPAASPGALHMVSAWANAQRLV
jgi:hypothetical protein